MSTSRLGVDIGGTFTDAVMMDEATGEIRLVKMSSTPSDPSVGFMDVIERILRESEVPAGISATTSTEPPLPPTPLSKAKAPRRL